MLFKGGSELERIAQSELAAERIQIDATSQNLYLKDKKVWGHVRLIYAATAELSIEENQKLLALGFSQRDTRFYQSVYVEGLLYPPISETQDSLKIRRPIHLYTTQKAAPFFENYAAMALLPLAVVTDVILTPLYLGFGIVVITANALD